MSDVINSELFQVFFGVSVMVCTLVGAVTIITLVVMLIFAPVAKFVVRTVKALFREDEASNVQWNQMFETYDGIDGPTQTILPPVLDPQLDQINLTNMPGLAHLAGRPIEARSDKPDFMDAVTTMHHQM